MPKQELFERHIEVIVAGWRVGSDLLDVRVSVEKVL